MSKYEPYFGAFYKKDWCNLCHSALTKEESERCNKCKKNPLWWLSEYYGVKKETHDIQDK